MRWVERDLGRPVTVCLVPAGGGPIETFTLRPGERTAPAAVPVAVCAPVLGERGGSPTRP